MMRSTNLLTYLLTSNKAYRNRSVRLIINVARTAILPTH